MNKYSFSDTVKKLIGVLAVFVLLAATGMESNIICIDLNDSPREITDLSQIETITFDPAWGGAAQCTVKVNDMVVKTATDAGTMEISPWKDVKGSRTWTLTHTAGSEVYTAEYFYTASEITSVKFRPRYPWNGLVDIDVTVTGMGDEKIGLISCVVSNLESKTALKMETIKYGEKTINSNFEVSSDGTYRLVWDAKTDLKTGRFEQVQIYAELKVLDFNGHEGVQLWENSPYWATTNIGAEKPEDCGYYFWWGDTVGYKRTNNRWVATDGSSSDFRFYDDAVSRSTYGKDNAMLEREGWIREGNLVPEHDAATAHWGGKWRMPTRDDIDELCSKTERIWTTQGGVCGYLVKGKDEYASTSIFIPAAGSGYGSSLDDLDFNGRYWSSTPYSGGYSFFASNLSIHSSYCRLSAYNRYFGFPVRAVLDFTK